MAVNRKKNLRKIAINFPNEILEKLEDIAELKGVTRTQMIIMACSNYIDQRETFEYLPKLLTIAQEEKEKQDKKDKKVAK